MIPNRDQSTTTRDGGRPRGRPSITGASPASKRNAKLDAQVPNSLLSHIIIEMAQAPDRRQTL